MKVLLVEPNKLMAQGIVASLTRSGLECDVADHVDLDVTSDYQKYVPDFYDAVVIGSIDNPETMVHRIRSADYSCVLVALLDVRSSVQAVTLLSSGCDDVIVKPLNGDELKARINAVSRRLTGHCKPFVMLDELTAYFDGRDPEWKNVPITLTHREMAIFCKLAQHAGQVVSKDRIYDHVYGMSDQDPYDKVIDVYICKIRKKLVEASGKNFIETVYGRGYRLEVPEKHQFTLPSLSGTGKAARGRSAAPKAVSGLEILFEK